MLQLSKIIASLFAGCFCTWTIQQVPALGETLLPQTHPIPDHIPPVSAAADVLPSETLPIPAETAPAISVPPTETQISQTETVSAAAAITTTCPIATATTTLSSETTVTDSTETETAAASTQATIPQESQPEADPFFREHETWFKAYMDYRTITDTESVQYAMQQNAWTDDRGLRRTEDDYLVAMGTGWLEAGCGERFIVALESGSVFTVRVGDIKADQHTDETHRYRSCGSGANVLEFIVDTGNLSGEARNAGTVSVYPELSGNITAIVPAE